MERQYKVSVIIPIFGVEKFIERCARHLFSQTLDDIEFIFVNDCTPDDSMAILNKVIDDYPSRKPDIKILHHSINKGLPQARKTGLSTASGLYVAHCDSDDWVEDNAYELLYSFAVSGAYDIVMCDYFLDSGVNAKTKVKVVSGNDRSELLQGPVWNKLVKRSLYSDNNIIYPVANKAEDGALLTQLSYYSKSRGYLHRPLYHYFFNPESICRRNSPELCLAKMAQEMQNTQLRIDFLCRENVCEKYLSDIILWKYWSRNALLPYISDRKYFEIWKDTYPEINKTFFTVKSIPLKQKVIFFLRLNHLLRV